MARRRTTGSRRTPNSKRTPGNQSEGISANFDGMREGEISIGWEQSGIGLEVTISPSTVELTLGIGIASVTLDLGEPNNSSISYAFDIYEIKGTREGCNVRLDYYISGQLTKSENRTIPECEKEEEDKENDRDEGIEDDFRPRPWEMPIPSARYGIFVIVQSGSIQEQSSNFITNPQYWIYWNECSISYKVSLRNIVHRNPQRRNFFSAAYIFDTKRTGFRISTDFHGNYTEGTEISIDKSLRGEVALILGERDSRFYEKIQSSHTRNIFYNSTFVVGTVTFPDIVRAPGMACIIRIKTGLHSVVVREIADIPYLRFASSSNNGWRAKANREFGVVSRFDRPESYSIQSGNEIVFEHFYDPPPSEPPMMVGKKRCCEEMKDCCKDIEKLEKLIKQTHKALAVKELLDKGLEVPNRLAAPNAKGQKKLENYLDIATWQMRISDHLGIHPFKASLSDANAAKAGNQKVEIQFASGTAALNKIVELLLENKGDAAARLNLQIRSAVALAQILKVATITSKTASAIANFIGMPLKEKISKIKMPFDVSLGKRRQLKGFDPSGKREAAIEAIGMNEEASTEEILPEFLQTGEQPYVHETYDGNFPNLIEQLKGQGRNG